MLPFSLFLLDFVIEIIFYVPRKSFLHSPKRREKKRKCWDELKVDDSIGASKESYLWRGEQKYCCGFFYSASAKFVFQCQRNVLNNKEIKSNVDSSDESFLFWNWKFVFVGKISSSWNRFRRSFLASPEEACGLLNDPYALALNLHFICAAFSQRLISIFLVFSVKPARKITSGKECGNVYVLHTAPLFTSALCMWEINNFPSAFSFMAMAEKLFTKYFRT